MAILFPAETSKHLNNATKELLLAMRSWLDARIEALDERAEGRSRPLKKVDVK